MANKVYNMEGGLHSAAAYSAFENAMFGSCVASATDFVATAGTGMNISLSAGNGMIDTGQGYSRRIASDATNTIPVTAASSANPRMDAVVAYIDNGVTPTTSVIDNTNNILKFACVAGSPAATPQAPSAATIQSAIGAGNPYVILWYVTIPTSATSLSNATFTDNRYVANRINSANIADGAVTSAKIDWTTIQGVLRYQKQLTKSDNLNTIGDVFASGTDGVYGLNMYTGSGGSGQPSENTNGVLIVATAPTYNVVVQYIIGGGVIYTRRYAGNTWGHWFKYPGTDLGA